MPDISFTSSIKVIPTTEFNKFAIRCGKNAVNYPWTIKDSIKATNTYTKNIADCSACVISTGEDAVMLHLSPINSNNHAFSLVLEFLRNTIDLKNPNLQAILVGSKNTTKSQDIFNKFKTLLTQLNIPYSELKNSKTPINIGYSSNSDEFIVSNLAIDKCLKKGMSPKEILNNNFENINIAQCDNIQ